MNIYFFMPAARLYLWNKAPALRLLLPLMAGVTAQWYLQSSLYFLVVTTVVIILLLFSFRFLPVARQFVLKPFYGFVLMLLVAVGGAWLVWWNDVRHSHAWIGHKNNYAWVHVTLEEPLVEKPKSYKALASVLAVGKHEKSEAAKGKVILYFKKDPAFASLRYGSTLVVTRPLQQIKNSGNPGSFDYRRYTLFQGITHQAYVTPKDVVLLPQRAQKGFKTFLYNTRTGIIATLRQYINGPQERGLAEALLIGYKDDLDKTLVQAYVNTGVVHVIAISGLHLGIIYFLLLFVTRPLKRGQLSWLRIGLVIISLWLFALLAGAQASVVRSAVMFTAIALGGLLNRKANIYNTLALSALLLLLYNPFWLWDAGFQLSYAAVLSIVIFFKPIYNWIYFKNKIIDAIWKLMAVTLAAQLLTLPVSLYHFHQFPLLFFITNLVAVPLSSVILIGEIILCAVSFLPPVASFIGSLLQSLIRLMNGVIQQMDAVSFASWQNISISFWQAVWLAGMIAGAGFSLLHKGKSGLHWAAVCLLLFVALHTSSIIQTGRQQKLIVYNIPRYQAMDVMDGHRLFFIGDAEVEKNQSLYNFHLAPSRILHRAMPSVKMFQKAFDVGGKKVLLIDTTIHFKKESKPVVDVLILSNNPKLQIHQLQQSLQIGQVVIDASVPHWKAAVWQKSCDSLQINCYNVAEKGAFVMQW